MCGLLIGLASGSHANGNMEHSWLELACVTRGWLDGGWRNGWKGASAISIRELMDGGTVGFTESGSQPLNQTGGRTLEIIAHCELFKLTLAILHSILHGARLHVFIRSSWH